MKKEELFEKLVEKGKTKEELERKYNEFKQEAIDYGFNESQQDTHAIRRMIVAYSKKTFGGNLVDYKGVFYGTKTTDFGATKAYKLAKERFAEDQSEAVSLGMTDPDGNPLYTKGFNKGNKIDLDNVWVRQYFGVVQVSGKFYPVILSLKNENANKKIPLFTWVDFNASDKFDNGIYKVTNASELKCEVGESLRGDQIEEFIKEFIEFVDFRTVREKAEEHKDNWDYLCAIKGNLSSLNLSDGNRSSILNLNDPDLDLDEIDFQKSTDITCWFDSSYDIDCTEGALDIIVIGKPTIRADTDEVHMNSVGLHVPEQFRKPKNVGKVQEETTKEEKPKEETKQQTKEEDGEEGKWIE